MRTSPPPCLSIQVLSLLLLSLLLSIACCPAHQEMRMKLGQGAARRHSPCLSGARLPLLALLSFTWSCSTVARLLWMGRWAFPSCQPGALQAEQNHHGQAGKVKLSVGSGWVVGPLHCAAVEALAICCCAASGSWLAGWLKCAVKTIR